MHGSTSRPGAAAHSRERAIRTGLGVLAAINLFTGLFMVVDPAGFVDRIGPFGEVNDHYVRDVASWTLAYAVALLVAAGQPRWRIPVLGFGIVQSVLHIVNHLVDVGDADPGWLGVFDVVSLTVILAVMWWLMKAARDEDGSEGARRRARAGETGGDEGGARSARPRDDDEGGARRARPRNEDEGGAL